MPRNYLPHVEINVLSVELSQDTLPAAGVTTVEANIQNRRHTEVRNVLDAAAFTDVLVQGASSKQALQSGLIAVPFLL